jgi:hypothetical protein
MMWPHTWLEFLTCGFCMRFDTDTTPPNSPKYSSYPPHQRMTEDEDSVHGPLTDIPLDQ